MAKSKESFNKKEKEKKRLKQRQDKREKMEQRKSQKSSPSDMFAYLDEDGNLTSTPPDNLYKKREYNLEDIQISVPKQEAQDPDVPLEGKVSYFNTSKGFGFIIIPATGERVFVHVNQLTEPITENDKVSFEIEKGPRGLTAVNVKKL